MNRLNNGVKKKIFKYSQRNNQSSKIIMKTEIEKQIAKIVSDDPKDNLEFANMRIKRLEKELLDSDKETKKWKYKAQEIVRLLKEQRIDIKS